MDEYDIEIVNNCDWSLVVTWTDSGGSPIDLSAHTAIMTIREHASSVATLLQLTSVAGEIVINGPLGQLAITAIEAQAATLVAGRAVYDLVIISGAGVVSRVLWGNVVVVEGVT